MMSAVNQYPSLEDSAETILALIDVVLNPSGLHHFRFCFRDINVKTTNMSKVSSSITHSPPASSQFARCAKSHSRFSTCASELRRAPDVEAAFITRGDAIIDVPFSRRPFRVSKRPHGSVAGSVKFIPSLRVSLSADPRCDLPAAICVTIEA